MQFLLDLFTWRLHCIDLHKIQMHLDQLITCVYAAVYNSINNLKNRKCTIYKLIWKTHSMLEFIAWVPGNLKKNIKGNGVHTLLHISYYVSISYFSNRLMFIHGLYNVTGTTTPQLKVFNV